MAPRWIKGSKLSNKQIGRLVDYFALEVPALKAASILDINRHSAERVYNVIRMTLAAECERESPLSSLTAPGAAAPPANDAVVPVFGIIMRCGRAYTTQLASITAETMKRLVRYHTIPPPGDEPVDFGHFDALAIGGTKHFLIRRGGEGATSGGKRRPASADNFWSYVKTKLNRYYGVSGPHFNIYLKEMEFRYNHRKEDLRELIRDILKKSHH